MNSFFPDLGELYSNAPCGYHSLDSEGRFVRINNTELEMLGYSREELLGRKFSDLITSESLPIFEHNFSLFKQRGWVNDLEFELIRKNGTILPISVSAKAIQDEAGNFLMSHSVVIDISDRQQATLALQESEQKLSLFIQYAPVSVAMFDCNMYYLAVSQRWLDMYDLGSREEILGRSHYEIFPHIPDRWREAHQRGLMGSVEKCDEDRFVLSDGSVQWLRWEIQPWFIATGEVGGIAIFVEDISEQQAALRERKEIELALQQQLAREHLLAEITKAIYRTLNVEEVLQTAVNLVRQFLQTDRVTIFRFHPDWSGKIVAESVATEYVSILESEITDPCFEQKYIEPYRQGRVAAISDFPASDIETCYKELMAQFQVQANLVVPILQREKLWGLLISHQCSAARAWLSEEIELLQQIAIQLGIALQQAELYQKNVEQATLIGIASDAIFVRDLSNRILFWSHGAERLYGWTAEEVKNRVAYELFNQESQAQLEVALKITLDQGTWNGELKQLTKGDREIIVESRWTLMGDENPPLILVVNTDNTEKKQLEKQLLHAQRLESIGTLAGGIAHDLNNLLNPIIGFTQLLPLKIPNLDETNLKFLNIIKNNALRSADLVKQILLFSRQAESQWKLINLIPLLKEILKLIRETFPKSIVIEDDIVLNLWLLNGDFTQIHQVLMNLCINARDAMPDGGKLIIAAENLVVDRQYCSTNSQLEEGNYILISVTDTGIGISPEIRDRIFEPFFTTKKIGKGTGLGLSTVIGIVQNHGGVIEVESELQSGTQFKVFLPASQAIRETEETFDTTISSGREELILLVDDEASIREVTQASLEFHNYRVITASNGIEAIALYAQQSQEIAVVLMDLTMPEMDGITAMRILKKLDPDIKLIATSGMTTKENLTATELIGIESFLVKPYTLKKLLLNVRQAIS